MCIPFCMFISMIEHNFIFVIAKHNEIAQMKTEQQKKAGWWIRNLVFLVDKRSSFQGGRFVVMHDICCMKSRKCMEHDQLWSNTVVEENTFECCHKK